MLCCTIQLCLTYDLSFKGQTCTWRYDRILIALRNYVMSEGLGQGRYTVTAAGEDRTRSLDVVLCCIVYWLFLLRFSMREPTRSALKHSLRELPAELYIETIDHSGNLSVFYLRTRQQETACRPFSRRHCCACWRAFASSSFFYSTEHRWTTCWRSFRSWYHLRNRPTWTLQGAARSASDHSCISMWPRWCRPSLWTASRKRPIERRRRPALDYLRHQIINCIGCILMYSRK